MNREKCVHVLGLAVKVIVPMGIMAAGSVCAFGPAARKEVNYRQKGKCGNVGCRLRTNLQMHHRVPRAWGGSDHPDNCVALCPEHHAYWDQKTFTTGIIFPGIPVRDAQQTQIRDHPTFLRAMTIYGFGN